jgi:hypothetical protein
VSIFGNYYYLSTAQTQKPFDYVSSQVIRNPSNLAVQSAETQWKLLTFLIPASKDLSAQMWSTYPNIYARIYIGSPQTTAVTAYLDDIRFYPADAFVTTTYYNQILQKPILSVDANNTPSTKTLYDLFGRPSEIQKFVQNETNVMLERFNYHFMQP